MLLEPKQRILMAIGQVFNRTFKGTHLFLQVDGS
jgi:hypothetical protein